MAMFHPNDWPSLWPPGDLSDEAVAHIADLLMELVLCFEGAHLSQIRRHHQAMRQLPTYDPNQLDLFDPF